MMKPQKPFPWKCGECGERAVTIAAVPYSVDSEHDGRVYSVTLNKLQAPQCATCGAIVLDDDANRQISDALREKIGLLTPEQIRDSRERIGLTQKKLAAALGIAEATLSRWETGAQIQQRVMDRYLRVYFAFPVVRDALADEGEVLLPGLIEPHGSQAVPS